MWRARAACRGVDPGLFFDEETEAEAKALCSVCPVQAECLGWALDVRPVEGVFGGANKRERKRLIRLCGTVSV